MTPLCFGVRHLSPGGAHHLLRLLDERQPRCVLVEGPADGTPLALELVRPGVLPPVAVLAYTADVPVASLYLPLAEYSPEYQAMLWAARHGAACRLIDLPTDIELAARHDCATETDPESQTRRDRHCRDRHRRDRHRREANGLYDELARLDGWDSFDSYWEANFEHNTGADTYRLGVREHAMRMRERLEAAERAYDPEAYRHNLLREAHMRREIALAMDEGYAPGEIVVVCGAYHLAGLEGGGPPMNDEELAALPRRETRMTLMPYSYFKLSSQSGYGAGNRAPAYFERLWRNLRRGNAERLPAEYLSALAAALRDGGANSSTASVIEAARLAHALAALKGHASPILADLRDAAVACLGGGELSAIATALAHCDVGTAIGALPSGVSQTPVQDDFARQMAALKLEKYRSTVARDLELDLRENRRAQSEAASYLDLNRSTLLHRLRLLGVSFALLAPVRQQAATWYEKWGLRWTPESEIQLVETTLKGETIEIAAGCALKERLRACTDVLGAAALIRTACECQLPASLSDALGALQALTVDAGSIEQVAGAAHELCALLQYGDVRRVATEPLRPLLTQLFLRACLLLSGSAACDDRAADAVLSAINLLHAVSQQRPDDIDDALWLERLRALAFADDRNARLSGAAFAILLERGEIPERKYATEVSRRLSPGTPAELGAGWFEGLAGRNRWALLSRAALWRELDDYIEALSEEEYARCLVFLRRAFSAFDAREKNSAAELLGGLWNIDSRQTAELLQAELSQTDQAALDALNDFDFGDL